MPSLLPTYLKTLRMRWGLTQLELAGLLGMTESALSKFETLANQASVNLVFGVEIIFGQSARAAFPALYAQTERNIMRRAAVFSERLESMTDPASILKRRLLTEMIDRSVVGNKHL